MRLGDEVYQTSGFRPTSLRLQVPVSLDGQDMGTLTEGYTDPRADGFLEEESDLLRNVAQMAAYFRVRWDHSQSLEDSVRQLKDRNATINALLDALPDMLFVLDAEGTILDFRAGTQEDLALPPEQFLHRKVTDLFPPDLGDRFAQLIGQVIDTGKGGSLQYQLSLGGSDQYYEARMSKYGDRAVISLVNNITAIKAAQQKIHRSEQNYRNLFFQAPYGHLILWEGKFIECNEAAAELITKTLETGTAQFEWVHRCFDGTLRLTEVNLCTMEYDERPVIVSTWRDVTDQRKAEDQVRQLSQAVEQSPVSIVITDLDGRIEYANPMVCTTTGYSLEELRGQNPRVLKSGETSPEDYTKLWGRLTSGGSWSGLFHNKRKSGELYWESSTIAPIKDDQGRITHYLAVKEDVTLSRQVEAARIARTVAEEASKSKSTFLSNMSHEIRTPLNAILGFAQILQRDKSLGDKQREQVGTIARSGNHLLRLINDILDLSKIESGKAALAPRDFNLYDLLEDLRSIFTATAGQKGLQLLCEWRETVPRFVHGDEGKLRQIFINILGNAIKFTQTGGVAFRVKAGGDPTNLLLQAEVEDSGPGIPPQDLEHIFDSFQQSQAGREVGGTGLGLAISRQLLEMMGGAISVESVFGTGTIFRITVPLSRAEEGQAKAGAEVEELDRLVPGHPSVRILVADDIQDNRTLLRTLLESSGFEVREAVDGVETLEAVDQWQPHALLLDLRMPRMDGYETVGRLRDNPATRQLPVVAVTASAFEDDEKIVRSAGFHGYVRKPFRPQEILAVLQTLLPLEFEKTAAPPRKREKPPVEPVAVLAPGLKDELEKALEAGNMTKFRALLPQVATVAPGLAKTPEELARGYDYDRLGALFRND